MKRRKATVDEIASEANLPPSSVFSLTELLRSRGVVEIYEREVLIASTTDEGKRYLDALPEEIVAREAARAGGSIPISMLKELLGDEIANIGIMWAKRRGWIELKQGSVHLLRIGDCSKHREFLRRFLNPIIIDVAILQDDVFQELVKRKLIKIERKLLREVILPENKLSLARTLIEAGAGVSHLTRDLIVSGVWRQITLKPYNVEALPPKAFPGRTHFLEDFIEMIRDVMDALGFEEFEDDYVVAEFWNFDVLFQAQDHPSRDIHDIFVLDGSASLESFNDLVSLVSAVHEYGADTGSRGWGYKWDPRKSAVLILRSHTTAATIRYLYQNSSREELRAYTIGRVFRRDRIDAKHLPEFTNFDGIIMERDFNFRKLLGILTQIMRGLGFKEVKFRPSYFPFTEPSVEGMVHVEGVGWLEVFGAGMFRPEVLRIAGARHPVGAWGMGVERLAMALLGINDIRLLYSSDVEFLRSFPYSKMIKVASGVA